MLNHSDSTLAVAAAIFLVLISGVTSYAYAKLNVPGECAVTVYQSKAETHVWHRPCRFV